MRDTEHTIESQPDESPAAQRHRERFETQYGPLAGVMRMVLRWRSRWSDWQRPYNLQMETPVTEGDVDRAESEMLQAVREYAAAEVARAAEAIVWPKDKSVKRRDDMSASDALQVGIDESGDLQVSLWTEKAGYSSVEFCSGSGGGGRSPRTRRALIALMVAMEADATASPIRESVS